MSKHERDVRLRELPKPVTLTPDQVRHVAAGAATVLSSREKETGPPVRNGPPVPPK
jgi:hypothetical protein